ncbi:CRISPR-associated endoribonuclease Cas6 [Candidatus Bathyarchaeota archaeon]|nr:MAG: CRISPR-associated endoribonuclease Cas6 [Candidatus Bathyarchaeota archaeon]
MRLLVEVKALCDAVYDLKYHHKLQGFLYRLLKDTAYSNLHDRRGYKFFSFSNIFPPEDMREGDVRRFLIASPDPALIETFREQLAHVDRVNVGDMSFSLQRVSVLRPRIGRSCTLVAATPIIVRIPKANYRKYGIEPPKDYPYVYWRKRYPFEAFIKQLEDNLIKKFKAFHGEAIEPTPIFEEFVFRKQVCNHIIVKGREVKVFGSLWTFIFKNLYKDKRRIIQFGLETGFGELNSLGFGFINPITEKKDAPRN